MVKNIANVCSAWFSTNQLVSISGEKAIFPFYHLVSDNERDHVKHLYPARSVCQFKEDLEFLLKHFKPVSLQELIALKNSGAKPSEKVFHLTFDDGLSEIFTEVVPILKEKNIPATFFINTDFLDNKALFFRYKASLLAEELAAKGLLNVGFNNRKDLDEFASSMEYDFNNYLIKESPYMTTSQVQSLIDDGFTIGGHSVNHPLYADISEVEQIKQTLDSVNFLVKRFDLDYKVFAFPFTDEGVGLNFYKEINESLDLTFGTAGIKKDVAAKNLQRIPMEENKKGSEIIKFQYLYYILKSFAGKNKVRR